MSYSQLRAKLLLLLCGFILPWTLQANDTTRVLFIGNSYTAVNNLPQIIKDMATEGGHQLIVASSTPGGMTLQGHLQQNTSLHFLDQGNWDFVVLQEQSQIPSFPEPQVEQEFYPYAKTWDSLIKAKAPCAKTIFYMTWGRKNGDQQNCPYFPPLCSYEGMDSMLYLRYTNIADSVQAYISPVGPLWHFIRLNTTIELYQQDESHPSTAGSFAAACAFYTLFFNESPSNNLFSYTLPNATAQSIKDAAQRIVYDSLNFWKRFRPEMQISFDYHQQSDTFVFNNQSENAEHWSWDFGDGNFDTTFSPTHVYHLNNERDTLIQVCLTLYQGCDSLSLCEDILIEAQTTGLSNLDLLPVTISVYPNPIKKKQDLIIESKQGNYSEVYYLLRDHLGRILAKGYIPKLPHKLTLEPLPSGHYYLQLFQTNEGLLSTQKLILLD